MKVFADLRWPAGTGIGVVASEILARTPEDIQVIDLNAPLRVGSPLSPLSLAYSLSRNRARSGVFWSPGFVPPISCSIPRVITVHDLTHLHFYSKAHAAYYRLVLRRLYRSAEKLICVSKYTAQELADWCALDPSRIQVVYNGVSTSFRPHRKKSPAPIPAPYIFYAGNRRSYKNLHRLIRAFARSRLPTEGMMLALSGSRDLDLLEIASEAGCRDALYFTGSLNSSSLAEHYATARGVAFVSLYEGFGLPILEGMASGVPVLTSNVSAMPEVAGNAAILVDPYEESAITAGLETLAYDSAARNTCIARGLARASEFSWENTASSTWSTLRSLGPATAD